MALIKTNLSDFARQISHMKGAMFRSAGRALSEAFTEEFEVLVKETPQWSGTTAASWRMGFKVPEVSSQKPKPPKGQELSKGRDPAVSEAIGASTLSADLSEYVRQDLLVTNGSPNFEHAEQGPLRDVNKPPGALARFEARVASRVIDIEELT